MTTEKQKEMHEIFKAWLAYSRRGVGVVVPVLTAKGFDVHVPKDLVAEKFEDRMDYRDSGDIKATYNGEEMTFEVKRIGITFRKGNWRFNKEFILDDRYKFDHKETKIRAYYVVSDDLQAYAVVQNKNFKHRTVKKIPDPLTGVLTDFYIVDPCYVDFYDIKDDLKRK